MTAGPFRVLSIDGGGVRAHLPALLLAELERRAGTPLVDLFDLIVGTSTGGIIGMAAAVGIPASELAVFFPRCAARIFGAKGSKGGAGSLEQRLEQSSRTLGALFGGGAGGPRHRADGLESVLRDVFGDTTLAQVHVPLAVSTFDATSLVPVVLASRDALANPIFDLPLVEVGRATSAAPQVFPPLATSWAGGQHSFIDGGVWASNPSSIALSEALALTRGSQQNAETIVLVSLGTGAAPGTTMVELNKTWLGEAHDPGSVAASVWVGEVIARRTLAEANFHRLQVVDRRIVGTMDDPSPERLAILGQAADGLIATQSAALDAAVARLVGS